MDGDFRCAKELALPRNHRGLDELRPRSDYRCDFHLATPPLRPMLRLKRRAASGFLRSERLAKSLRKRVKPDWAHMLTNGHGSSQANCAVSCTPENESTHFRRVNLPRR